MAKNNEYPSEIKDAALNAVEAGFTTYYAAKLLGVYPQTVKRWAIAAGVAVPNSSKNVIHPAEIKAAAIDGIEAGYTPHFMSVLTGVDARTIERWADAAGIPYEKDQHRRYPPEIINAALDGLRAGYSGAEMANLIGVASATINRWAADANVVVPRYNANEFPQEIHAAVLDAYGAGFTAPEIEGMIGVKATVVYGWVSSAGIPSQQAYPKELKAAAESAHQAGFSTLEIANMLGVSRAWVQRRVVSNRVPKDGIGPASKPRSGDGYTEVTIGADHWLAPHTARRRGRMLTHRAVMAIHIGRPLDKCETVHHLNGDRADNRIENLELHGGHHGNRRKFVCASCGSAERVDGVVCANCKSTNWKAAPLNA